MVANIARAFSLRRRMIYGAAALAAVVALGAAAWSVQHARRPTEISVIVSIKVCPPSSSDCYLLRVPDADVVINGRAFAKNIATNSSGSASTTLPGGGKYSVTARSFIVKGTQLEGSVEAKIHENNVVNLVGEIVPYAVDSAN